MEFLGPVPTVWDETKVLQAKIGYYVIVARRHGRDWYIGAMTDWSVREFVLDLSFLPRVVLKCCLIRMDQIRTAMAVIIKSLKVM
jgi:alpha-glucosidase